jgi:hypothetical protein
MSNRYKGAVISATPPTTTGGESGTASGAWTLEQQMQLQAAGLWPLQPTGPYIEEVFSTYLYTGNNSTQTITNGIDLSTKGGMVWSKSRSSALSNFLCDTVRGRAFYLYANATVAQQGPSTGGNDITSFNTNGYSLGPISNADINNNAATFVSWTFREQPKFFDVVTYSGTGAVRTVAHNLGSVPGCILIKNLSDSDGWLVYHQSIGATKTLSLNTTGAAVTDGNTYFNDTEPTSTVFTVKEGGKANASGNNYVAYIFAHNAGGFGLTGTDNVISCGSYTGNGSTNGPTVTLGYEPQWLLVKNASSALSWYIVDNMRGFPNGASLFPNDSSAESNALSGSIQINATGFTLTQNYAAINASGNTYIYIAIRRGPMRTPTVGTTVYAPVIYTGDNSNTRVITTGFPPDMVWTGDRTNGSRQVMDRLRGLFTNPGPVSNTNSSSDEQFSSYSSPQMNGWQTGNGTIRYENSTAVNYVLHAFKRAPSFFDVVCYTGVGGTASFSHNLGVVPELIFVKERSVGNGGLVYNQTITASKYLKLFFAAEGNSAASNDTGGFAGVTPTSSVFTVGFYSNVNTSGQTYVAYLFATCPGVSKVGTYTGTGAAQTINCGFAAGSRFVLIKRTDSTGDWYLWDSARGIIPSNDPYLLLNTTDAETTGTDYVDTTNVGFDITSTAPAAINANGGTFIFLAIA